MTNDVFRGALPEGSITRENYARLQESILKRGKAVRWLVLTHDNPDPDALAAALILGRVIRTSLKHHVTLAYGGIVGRAENREMFRVLRLPFVHIRDLNLRSYQAFALVDTQPRSGNNQLPPRLVPDVVIDHHPLRTTTQGGPFHDVRPEYGATATILAEYMLAAGIEPTHGEATALIYAIRSETQDFAREFTGRDKAIYDLFFPRANHRLLARIQSPRLPLTYFANLHDALENLESVDTLVVSHLGNVEQPDIVPEIADLLLRLEGKTWALCTGFYQDRLYLSIRTTNARAEAGSLMHRLLGRGGKGGGHGRTAGGWIDSSKVQDEEARRKLQRGIATRLARELKKNPEKLTRIELRAARPGSLEERPANGQPPAPALTGSKSRAS